MLKRYMHKRERYFAMLNDNRVIRPFEWGTEFISDHPNGDNAPAGSSYATDTLNANCRTITANIPSTDSPIFKPCSD